MDVIVRVITGLLISAFVLRNQKDSNDQQNERTYRKANTNYCPRDIIAVLPIEWLESNVDVIREDYSPRFVLFLPHERRCSISYAIRHEHDSVHCDSLGMTGSNIVEP